MNHSAPVALFATALLIGNVAGAQAGDASGESVYPPDETAHGGASHQHEDASRHGNQDPDEATAVPMLGFNVGGLVGIPMGDSSDVLDVGGGFAAGIMFRPKPFIGLQFEYSYSWYGLKNDLLPNLNADGLSSLQYWDLNIMARPARIKRFGFYLIAGPGIYRRMAEITRFDGVTASTYCSPGTFFCYSSAVPATTVVASRHSIDFGLNGGIGMYLVLRPPLRLYLEARFHYIFGPEFTSAAGKKESANGEYLPITLGLAF